jgi:hypothetical protein
MTRWSELLTEHGPVLDIGTLIISPDVWRTVPAKGVAAAVWLHECGHWGAIPHALCERNHEALRKGGLVVSQWYPAEHWPFAIATDTLAYVTLVYNPLDG